MRTTGATLAAAAVATGLAAQKFHPPAVRRGHDRGTRLGLFGFGVRGGLDRGSSQLVLGTTLDAGNLVNPRLRLRPAIELGIFHGANTYAGSVEVAFRFTGDERVATPYLGGGFSLAGHDGCAGDPDCPGIWAHVLVGVELHYRSTLNWLLEYLAIEQ